MGGGVRGALPYTVCPNKKETRFISEISSLPSKFKQITPFITKSIFSSFIIFIPNTIFHRSPGHVRGQGNLVVIPRCARAV